MTIVILNQWEKLATDFTLGIILHLQAVIKINIIYFCLGKKDPGSGPLYPIMGLNGQILYSGFFTKKLFIPRLT